MFMIHFLLQLTDTLCTAGNVVSLVLGALICVVVSLIWPEDYDFVSMKQIRMIDSEDTGDGMHGFAKV